MTARRCFTRKVAAGRVSERAGRQLLDMLDAFEDEHNSVLGDAAGARQAAAAALEASAAAAARKADLARRSIVAQANVLRSFQSYNHVVTGLGANAPFTIRGGMVRRLGGEISTLFPAVRSLLMRDPHEVANWLNVDKLAQDIRGRAHAGFASAIEAMRPKMLGFKAELAAELDTLRALYGETSASPAARASAEAFNRVSDDLAGQFIDAGGELVKRQDWRLPNPTLEPAKIKAIGAERFKALVRENVDRDAIKDFSTGARMSDARFEQLLDEAATGYLNDFAEGPPSAAAKGRKMLANSRDAARLFVWKSAESWLKVAEAVGVHASPFQTMMDHVGGMADDIAMMRILGPNPEATKRFIGSLFDREAARLAVQADPGAKVAPAVRANERIQSGVKHDRQLFENAWAEVTGTNRVPVNSEVARTMSDMRSALTAAQMGSAMVSSITDPASLVMTARWNGIPAMRVVSRAVGMMGEKGSEIFAAQQGLIADSIASDLSRIDRAMGETIRTGRLAKMGSATIRASGLRRWSATLRNAFGLEMMAHAARERGKAFAELDDVFREALGRYGIGAEEWKAIAGAAPFQPKPNALLTRPLDVAAGGSPLERAASERWSQMINTEMDYAVIEHDPVARALLVGDTRPGDVRGELNRAFGMYKMFPTAFITMHFARAFARGFDGKRMTHGALTFLAMSSLGILAMQSKQILAGRDPYSLDPTTGNGLRAWGAGILQGGGLGVFGDMLFVDKTRFGNSWATVLAGPQFAAMESVVGDFVVANVQRALNGEETHFLGDALYIAGRYAPGSSLWYGRLAFQRAVLDQLQLIADPRARDRFRRLEDQARKSWGQEYWYAPGETAPRRAPAMMGAP